MTVGATARADLLERCPADAASSRATRTRSTAHDRGAARRRRHAIRTALVAAFENELYARLYRRPATFGARTSREIGEAREFVNLLSDANAGTGTWEADFRVTGTRGGRVLVMKEGIVYAAAPQRVRIEAGTRACRVQAGKDCARSFRDITSREVMPTSRSKTTSAPVRSCDSIGISAPTWHRRISHW